MMDGSKKGPLTAILIDPDACCVELIQVGSNEVTDVLRSSLTRTLDFEDGNCLVIDDGNSTAVHPARFHLADDALERPYFGVVLILGLENGNWSSTTADVEGIRARIIWEHWDVRREHYSAAALQLA